MSELGAEISTALADIVAHLESAPDDRLEALLAEVSSALADIAAALEKKPEGKEAPEDCPELDRIAAAIGALKLAPVVNVAAPQVQVNVNPTPITVEPAHVVLEMPASAGWVFDVSYRLNGDLDRITAKPLIETNRSLP